MPHFKRLLTVRQTPFLLPLALIILINSYRLYQDVSRGMRLRKAFPYFFDGVKFSGLDDILTGQDYVGYFTDKNLDEQDHAQQFAQAQYQLAPIVLDLHNTAHEYIFFDCSSEKLSWQKIQDMGFLPLRRNQFGIILAKNPRFQKP